MKYNQYPDVLYVIIASNYIVVISIFLIALVQEFSITRSLLFGLPRKRFITQYYVISVLWGMCYMYKLLI